MPTPLFELALYTSGSPWYHDVPRFVRRAAPRRRGVSPASSAPPLWEKLAPIRQRACGDFGLRSSVGERSVASSGGVVGGFRDVPGKPVFGAYFWGQVKLFDF